MWPLISARLQQGEVRKLDGLLVMPRIWCGTRFTSCGSCAIIPENSLLNSLLAGNLTLKNWRRIATRYDRYGQNYLSGLALAAIMIAWI